MKYFSYYIIMCDLAYRHEPAAIPRGWFETGTPSYLAETLQQTDYPLDRLLKEEATSQLQASLDSLKQTPIPLIYQSGYLTIKSYDPDFRTYKLGSPNKEVEHEVVEFLAKNLCPSREALISHIALVIPSNHFPFF